MDGAVRRLRAPVPSIQTTLLACCEVFEVRYRDLLGPRRQRHLVDARHVAMFLARYYAGWSYPKIGEALCRDHSTVMHGIGRIQRRIAEDPDLALRVQALAERVEQAVM